MARVCGATDCQRTGRCLHGRGGDNCAARGCIQGHVAGRAGQGCAVQSHASRHAAVPCHAQHAVTAQSCAVQVDAVRGRPGGCPGNGHAGAREGVDAALNANAIIDAAACDLDGTCGCQCGIVECHAGQSCCGRRAATLQGDGSARIEGRVFQGDTTRVGRNVDATRARAQGAGGCSVIDFDAAYS